MHLWSLIVAETALHRLVLFRIIIWNHRKFSSYSWFGVRFVFRQQILVCFVAFCKHLTIRPLHFSRLYRIMSFYMLIDWSFEIRILICIGVIFWNLDSQLLLLKRKWWRSGSWRTASLLLLIMFTYRWDGITSLWLDFRSSSSWRSSCKNNLVLVADILCLFPIVCCLVI